MANQARSDLDGGSSMTKLLSIELDSKTYRKRSGSVTVLKNFSLSVEPGEAVAIVGESGSGKSSLLNILGLIDKRYQGTYLLFDRNVKDLSDREAASWRNGRLGFVVQESALINSMTIADNVMLPLAYAARHRKDEYRSRFESVVKSLGIDALLHKRPLECSGGEKSRAVFARAILMSPKLVLADEPTAMLDSENRSRMSELLFNLRRNSGSTIVTVTHDLELANRHDRVIRVSREA